MILSPVKSQVIAVPCRQAAQEGTNRDEPHVDMEVDALMTRKTLNIDVASEANP